MNITATANQNQLNSVDLTLEITMSLAGWRVVMEALDKGKDGYYGPANELRKSITATLDNYTKRVDGPVMIK